MVPLLAFYSLDFSGGRVSSVPRCSLSARVHPTLSQSYFLWPTLFYIDPFCSLQIPLSFQSSELLFSWLLLKPLDFSLNISSRMPAWWAEVIPTLKWPGELSNDTRDSRTVSLKIRIFACLVGGPWPIWKWVVILTFTQNFGREPLVTMNTYLSRERAPDSLPQTNGFKLTELEPANEGIYSTPVSHKNSMPGPLWTYTIDAWYFIPRQGRKASSLSCIMSSWASTLLNSEGGGMWGWLRDSCIPILFSSHPHPFFIGIQTIFIVWLSDVTPAPHPPTQGLSCLQIQGEVASLSSPFLHWRFQSSNLWNEPGNEKEDAWLCMYSTLLHGVHRISSLTPLASSHTERGVPGRSAISGVPSGSGVLQFSIVFFCVFLKNLNVIYLSISAPLHCTLLSVQ